MCIQRTGAATWHQFAPFGIAGIGSGAAYIFFAYIGFDAVSTTAQEAKNPQRDLPIGIIVSLAVCTVLYIGVAAVLTGMVPWQQVSIEALRLRSAFLDRGLPWASDIVTAGALAGLDQRDAGDAARPDARPVSLWQMTDLLPKKFFRGGSPEVPDALQEHLHGRLDCRDRGWAFTPIDRDRQDGEHRHAACVRHRLSLDHRAAPHRPRESCGPSARRGFRWCRR